MVFIWHYAWEYWNLIGLWQNLLLEILSSVHLQTRKYFLSILWVSWCVNYTFFFFFCIRIITIISCLSNVRTFWEIKMIWKRPSSWFWHLLSKSADLTNPWGRFFSNFVCFAESPNFKCNVHSFTINFKSRKYFLSVLWVSWCVD